MSNEVAIYDFADSKHSAECVGTHAIPESFERLGVFINVIAEAAFEEDELDRYRYCRCTVMTQLIRSYIEAVTEFHQDIVDELIEDLHTLFDDMKVGDLLYFNTDKTLVYAVGPSKKDPSGKRLYLVNFPGSGNGLVIPYAVSDLLENPVEFYRQNIEYIEEKVWFEQEDGTFFLVNSLPPIDNDTMMCDDGMEVLNKFGNMNIKVI